MNIYIVLAHQNPGSFNHAIAETAAEHLRAGGHEVFYHDLYAEKFDPILDNDELTGARPLDSVLQRHIDEMLASDGYIVVHPNWWNQPPAILRGWQDRVLRQGKMYRFTEQGVEGYLKGKRALVFTTSNTPRDIQMQVFGDPLEDLWKKCVFAFCGVTDFARRNFEPVNVSTPQQRKAWLDEVRQLVRERFAVQ